MENIRYTQHLKFRLELRNIPYELPLQIYKDADACYFDHGTQSYVALKTTKYKNKLRDMIVIYEKGQYVKLITIHPLKEGQRENRIKSGRWTKIEKA